MKKIVSCILVCLLIGLLALSVSADQEGPQITMQPQNYQYPKYSVAIYTVKATGTNLHATWYLEFEGKTYNLSDNTNGMEPWEAYAGENYGASQPDDNTFAWFFGGIEEGLNGAQIWCVIEDGHNDVTSDRAIITVAGDAMPPEIVNIPAQITAFRGDEVMIRCIARANGDAQLEFRWYETSTGKLPNIIAIKPEETSDFLYCSTEYIGTRYYVCYVTSSDGGRTYSSVVAVTVLDYDPEPPLEEEPVIQTDALPEGVVGQAYSVQLSCTDANAQFSVYYNPGKANDFSETGLTLSQDGKLTGTPKAPGSYSFCICAAGAGGEGYQVYTLVVKEAPTGQGTQATEKPADPQQPTAPAANPGTPGSSTSIQVEWWLLVAIGVIAAAIGVVVALIITKKK